MLRERFLDKKKTIFFFKRPFPKFYLRADTTLEFYEKSKLYYACRVLLYSVSFFHVYT